MFNQTLAKLVRSKGKKKIFFLPRKAFSGRLLLLRNLKTQPSSDKTATTVTSPLISLAAAAWLAVAYCISPSSSVVFMKMIGYGALRLSENASAEA